ncbi:MAG: YdiU family protein [Alphaproteobacteria bacterium]|nr:YdiU family protein [Rhizobiaceae bacterium]MBU3960556.1 YdiU family protein [Alphaproteobacteria bacterium]MBU4052562.1 YdiU family protein [Alphaproteobacteria bacterium]MBU4088980.1 YdiU family protein [Alphaproteobacteria bacterium]MBU4156587.1 YdiU family protein [Alphaproteobacteria bacterium]
MAVFAFDNSYQRLPERFYRPASPAAARAPRLIRFNETLAEELNLDFAGASDEQLAAIFSGNSLPEGAAAIAMAYAGHQFGNFVPQLGDGRAILMGEVVDRDGKRRDIQLKGAGVTPFSRNGDGRAALGPVLREYLISEAMQALGIPTTRALAAVLTGEAVHRETKLPGAVLTRVASSHIRIGTFQFFAARGDDEAIRTLADHVISRHYPELEGVEQPYLALVNAVAARQADLVARWLSVGFIHGVMNTDNMAVSGETIDFGPCAFLDEYDPRKVFSSIDQRGRYAYANQPGIAQWNLARFAETLLPLLTSSEEESVAAANAALADFGRLFQARWQELFRAKLGIAGEAEGDLDLVNSLLKLMQDGEADFTRTFRALGKVVGGADDPVLESEFADPIGVGDWLRRWRLRREGDPRTMGERQAAMEAVNPAVIPRNHRVEEAIQAGLAGDFTVFERLHAALQNPYAEIPEFAAYKEKPAVEERVERTFCGT